MTDNPCRDCVAPVRFPGCHAVCEKYGKWREELDKLNEEIRIKKSIERCARPAYPKTWRKR